MTFSNMTVQDKNVEVWPQNWVCRFRFGRGVPIGADYKAENRSCPQLGQPNIEAIISQVDCPKVRALIDLSEAVSRRSGIVDGISAPGGRLGVPDLPLDLHA
jgi:hypothetical protein